MRRRRTALWATALAVASGFLVIPTSAAQGGAPEAFTPLAAGTGQPCQVTLPDGLRATVPDGTGGPRLSDPRQAHDTVVGYRAGGHRYLGTADAIGSAADPAAYDVTALAHRTCGSPAATTATAKQPSADKGPFTMARLTLRLISADGQPPSSNSFVLLTDLDHSAYVDMKIDSPVVGSITRAVPAGHYAAAFVETVDGQERVTIEPDFTVKDGTSVTLDSRKATVPVTVPSTPRAADPLNASFSVYCDDGTAAAAQNGTWFEIFRDGAPLNVTVNATAAARHGKFQIVTTADLDSPPTAAEPYAYHLADSFDRAPRSYPTSVKSSSLATVDRQYTTSTGTAGIDLEVTNVTPARIARANFQTIAGYEFVQPGLRRTEYMSALPDMDWRGQLEDGQTHVLFTRPDTVYRAGQHTTETFGAGALHPSDMIDTGSGAVYCSACAAEDTMTFGLGSDGDTTPGTLAYSEAGAVDTNTVTLTRDGEVVSTGTDGLYEVSTPVPAGRARYTLRLETERTGTPNPLSKRTDTTWTFTANPGHGAALPAAVHCPGPVESCAALPLLYANTATQSDQENQVTAGHHTLSLTVRRQQYAPAARIDGARLALSYDGGTTWHDARVSGSDGSYSAAYTVPASAAGGTLSFRLSAWDSQGSRLDQTLLGAYGVR